MDDLLVAIGLLLALEGLSFAAFPGATKRAMALLLEAPDSGLRTTGMVAAVLGVALVWFVRG